MPKKRGPRTASNGYDTRGAVPVAPSAKRSVGAKLAAEIERTTSKPYVTPPPPVRTIERWFVTCGKAWLAVTLERAGFVWRRSMFDGATAFESPDDAERERVRAVEYEHGDAVIPIVVRRFVIAELP